MQSDLNNMVIFSKVAELSGISAAARALHLPKSKVSRRMAALENELGVRLLERTTRSVSLTEAGQIYYQHCRRIVEEARSARESINRMRETPRGHLRVNASIAVGQYLIGPHIGEFLQLFPEVRLEIQLDNRRVDIVAEGFDVVVRLGKLDDSALISKRLGTSYATLVASPDYLANTETPVYPEDLKEHRLIAMGDSPTFGHWDLNGPGNAQETVDTKSAIVLNDLSMIRQLAEDAGGIASLPKYLTSSPIASGALIEVLPEWRSQPIHIYSVYPSHRSMTLKLRAWIDFFSDKLADWSG